MCKRITLVGSLLSSCHKVSLVTFVLSDMMEIHFLARLSKMIRKIMMPRYSA